MMRDGRYRISQTKVTNTGRIIDLRWHPVAPLKTHHWMRFGDLKVPRTAVYKVKHRSKILQCRKLESDHDKRPVHLVADRGPLMLEPRFVLVILIHIENEQ